MAAAGDAPAGLFSGVWYCLHAAASRWRRRGEASGDDGDGENEGEEEATVRSRLVRRAAAARWIGRKIAFVSFNLEVLVFVYAFWRARRRSLSWRQPIQALPMLVIPALATLIYAAFIRFTRMFDLKDKKTLERLQEEKRKVDSERTEFDQNDRSNVQNCDDVDDASNSLVVTDSMAQTSKLRKHRQSSINLRADSGADMVWGHSKDFQPMPSDGLRQRRFSSGKTYMTNSSATESSEENTQKSPSDSGHSNQNGHVSVSTEDTVSYPLDDSHHSKPAISSILAEPANNHQNLPAGDGEEEGFDGLRDIVDTCSSSHKENPISPVGSHNSFCDRDNPRLSEHGISSLSTVFQELLVKVNEEHSPSPPEKLELSPVFIKEVPASPLDDFVAHSSLNDLSPNLYDPVPPASKTFEKLPAEGVKEEALLEPHKSAAPQMYSFTSEEIPTSCAVDDKGLIVTSDVETYPLPSISSNAHSNAAILNTDTVSPKSNHLPELLGEGIEETESSKFHIPEESMMPFNTEEVLVCPVAVNNIEHCLETPELSLCSSETEKMEVAGSVSFITVSPELSFLSSTDLVVDGGEDDMEKELCELNTKEENAMLINMEEEALQDPLIVSTSTSEHCLETSEVSLCIQDAKMTEVPGIINFVTTSPELNYPASPELLAEGDEDFKEDGTLDLHLLEQNGLLVNFEKEPVLDSVVADTAEHSLVTSEFLLYSEEVEMPEVHEVVKEGFFESEDEGAFNHRKVVVTSSGDDSNTQNLISNSMPVQFIPDADIKEALQGGQGAVSEPLHQSTCHSEGMSLSSGEDNNDEVYSSNSNLYFSYANVVEDEAPFSDQEGLSKSEDEMAITFLDTPIFLDEVRNAAIVNIDTVSPKLNPLPEMLGEGVEENESSKFHVPEENRTPFNLEEEDVVCPLAVNNIKHCVGTPDFSLYSQETEEMQVAGSVSFIKASPELSFLSSPELAVEGGEDAREKETCELNTKDENDTLFDLQEEALQGVLAVSTTEQCLETSEFSLCSQDAKMMEVPGVANFVTVSHELNCATSPGLLAEGDEDSKEDETPDLHLHEQKGLPSNLEKEPFLDPLVVDTAEDSLVTSELLLCIEEVNMTGVHGVVEEVLSESEDEGAFNHGKLVVTSSDDHSNAQNLRSNLMTAQFILDANVKEALQGGHEALSEPPNESTSDEGINSEIFSLYSRSSSCVSEVNMTETVRGGTSSEPENDRDFSSDERNPGIFHNMNSTEISTNSPTTAEFVLETNMMETAGSLREVSSNFLGTSVAPDVSNGIGQSDKHLNLLSSSFAPVVDAFEPLQTGQGHSDLQGGNDFSFQETKMSTKEVKNAENYLTNTTGDPQDGEKMPIVALQAAQHGLSASQDKDFTLHRTYMSPEDISDAENSLAADYASELPNTVESHCFSEKAKPESQDPLSSEEILVYPEEGSKAEKDLGSAKSPLCPAEVNLTLPLGIDQEETQQQHETIMGFEDIYMACQEATSENHFNNSGSQDIPDAIMADTLQGAERLSSEILYNGIFSFEGISISLDGESDGNFSNYSGSVMHTSEINTTSLLGLQEGSFKPKDEEPINSISPWEVDSEDTNSSNHGNSNSASSRHDISFVDAPQELRTDAKSEKVFPKDKKPNDGEFDDKKENVEDLDDSHNFFYLM